MTREDDLNEVLRQLGPVGRAAGKAVDALKNARLRQEVADLSPRVLGSIGKALSGRPTPLTLRFSVLRKEFPDASDAALGIVWQELKHYEGSQYDPTNDRYTFTKYDWPPPPNV